MENAKKFSKENRNGAAWIHEKDGKHLISVGIGKKGETKKWLVLLPNTFKKIPKHPDYILYEM